MGHTSMNTTTIRRHPSHPSSWVVAFMDQGITYAKHQKLLDMGPILRSDGDARDDSAAAGALPPPAASLSPCAAQSVPGGRQIL
jgi:hypothetical protein